MRAQPGVRVSPSVLLSMQKHHISGAEIRPPEAWTTWSLTSQSSPVNCSMNYNDKAASAYRHKHTCTGRRCLRPHISDVLSAFAVISNEVPHTRPPLIPVSNTHTNTHTLAKACAQSQQGNHTSLSGLTHRVHWDLNFRNQQSEWRDRDRERQRGLVAGT